MNKEYKHSPKSLSLLKFDTITEPDEEIEAMVAAFSPNAKDVDVAIQNMGLFIQELEEAISNIEEFAAMIPLHTEDTHALHYVEQIMGWCDLSPDKPENPGRQSKAG
jgi:hypothetical protein